MSRGKPFLVSILLLFGVVMSFGITTNVKAYVVTDDEGEKIDIPDKYFLESPEAKEKEMAHFTKVLGNSVDYWISHPDTPFIEINPEAARLKPAFAEWGTFNSVVARVEKTRALENIPTNYTRKLVEMAAKDFNSSNSTLYESGLDTEGFRFMSQSFSAILKPSDMTYYNATKNPKIDNCLKKAFMQWGKDKRFGFRMVNDPKDARIIVTDIDQDPSLSYAIEPQVEAAFVPTMIFHGTLVQGKIVLTSELESMPENRAELIHSVIHEVGHSIGRPDLF